jgi:DNA-binding MarR family transcriptional regulator
VNKLEERTWVERQRDDSDRRNIRIRITPAGAHLLQQLEGPLAAVHERQLGHLPASELNALIAALSAAGNPHEPDDSHWKLHHAN